MFLKQSTAYTFRLGPFLDSVDGNSQENALTIAAASVLLSKAGGALAAKTDATALTGTGANAHYTCVLDATDTGTLGTLRVWCHISGALAVWKDFLVIPALVYESLVAGSDNLQVDAVQVGGTSQTANDMSGDVDTILARIIGTLAAGTHPVQGGDAFARLGAPAGASVSADIAANFARLGAPAGASVAADIAAAKADSAAILDDTGTTGVKIALNALDAAALATDAVTEIVNAIKAAVMETEGSYTFQQIMSIALAVLSGVTSASGLTFKTPNGVGTRVAATVNASAERTAMTLTPSA